MKIRLYIVTYKRNDVLNRNLETLWNSVPDTALDGVTVLANHPSIEIAPENVRPNLRVIINTTRMPHAWGNLARDWNFGLLDGFRTCQNPENVDWVILAQNDVEWQPGWLRALEEHRHLDLITQPRGDQVVACRIEAIRMIGFFDERFTTIAYQEADFCIRAAAVLGKRASINDDHLGMRSEWNPTGAFMIKPTFTGAHEADNLHTARFSEEQGTQLIRKWRLRGRGETHDFVALMQRREALLRNLPEEINWYPFFWDGYPQLPESLHWQQELRAHFFRPTVYRRARSVAGRVKRKLQGFAHHVLASGRV